MGSGSEHSEPRAGAHKELFQHQVGLQKGSTSRDTYNYVLSRAGENPIESVQRPCVGLPARPLATKDCAPVGIFAGRFK